MGVNALLSALCLRALAAGGGNGGAAIGNALNYLANLQRPEGYWPAIPLRRLPSDPYVSAQVLYFLADEDRFRSAVRFDQAVQRLDADRASLDPGTRRLWDRVALRCRSLRVGQPVLTWAKSVSNAA